MTSVPSYCSCPGGQVACPRWCVGQTAPVFPAVACGAVAVPGGDTAWQGALNGASSGKQTEPGFPLGFCLCLAPFRFFFILKNSPGLNDYKYMHNMMQPPLCLKIWRVVICIQDKIELLSQMLCSITWVPCCKQDACFWIFLFCTGFFFCLSIRLVLCSNYNVDPFSVFSIHRL